MSIVMTWDGKKFDYMPRGKAEELERSGSLQIATGRGAAELKPKEAFKKKRKPRKRQLVPGKERQAYRTRELKAG